MIGGFDARVVGVGFTVGVKVSIIDGFALGFTVEIALLIIFVGIGVFVGVRVSVGVGDSTNKVSFSILREGASLDLAISAARSRIRPINIISKSKVTFFVPLFLL